MKTFTIDDISAMGKKISIERILKLGFGGFSLFFIGMLFFIVVHDTNLQQQVNIVKNMAF